MSSAVEAKDERLHVPLSAEAKTMRQRAANYRHKTVSQIVLTILESMHQEPQF
ncbi:hypothetical protein [Allopusillimonas soli]|uniref:hypothetical protein n=1 Tax=Allopusillimonas soli TaxID=659016 RepID=UPI001FD6C1E7|nr:hypothetical protein [Allopusillimonas soli]